MMGTGGRPAKATAAQRAEVERLAAEGVPIRAIAARVFGDARYRGRVERILRGPSSRPGVPPLGPAVAVPGLDPAEAPAPDATATIRAAFDRKVARIAAGEVDPSLGELRALLDLQRRLEAREAVERLNRLTRD